MDLAYSTVSRKSLSNLTMDNEYIHAAISDINTRRAYRANIEHFKNVERSRLSVTSKMIARYLLDSVHCHDPRTLSRRLTAIRQWHKLIRTPRSHRLATGYQNHVGNRPPSWKTQTSGPGTTA